jgi:hypothetical protein
VASCDAAGAEEYLAKELGSTITPTNELVQRKRDRQMSVDERGNTHRVGGGRMACRSTSAVWTLAVLGARAASLRVRRHLWAFF